MPSIPYAHYRRPHRSVPFAIPNVKLASQIELPYPQIHAICVVDGLAYEHPIGRAVETLAASTRLDNEVLATRLNVWLRSWTAQGFFATTYFP